MKEKFEVIAVDNQTMTLKVNRSACNTCKGGQGCGNRHIGKLF